MHHCCCGGFCTCSTTVNLTLKAFGPPVFLNFPPGSFAGTSYTFVYGAPPAGLSGVSNFASLPNPAYWCATSYNGSPSFGTQFAAVVCNDPTIPRLQLQSWQVGPTASIVGSSNSNTFTQCSPFRATFPVTSNPWTLRS